MKVSTYKFPLNTKKVIEKYSSLEESSTQTLFPLKGLFDQSSAYGTKISNANFSDENQNLNPNKSIAIKIDFTNDLLCFQDKGKSYSLHELISKLSCIPDEEALKILEDLQEGKGVHKDVRQSFYSIFMIADSVILNSFNGNKWLQWVSLWKKDTFDVLEQSNSLNCECTEFIIKIKEQFRNLYLNKKALQSLLQNFDISIQIEEEKINALHTTNFENNQFEEKKSEIENNSNQDIKNFNNEIEQIYKNIQQNFCNNFYEEVISKKKVVHLLPQLPYVCFVVKRAFSEEMCQKIIKEKKDTFSKANTHYPTSYRNNDRQVLDNKELSIDLFTEISQYIPKNMSTEGVGKDESGDWELKRLNDRIRVCRYLPDQYFNKHLDGVHYESADLQSKLTFMIYLNGSNEFEGGRTLFFPSKENDMIIQEFLPDAGDLIIFDHNIWHSGEMLTSGVKYILRSDILYQKQPIVNSIEKNINEQNSIEEVIPFKEGHLGYIWAIDKFCNDEHIATGGRDKLLKIWDRKGNLRKSIKAHDNSVLAILGLNNNSIITASRDQFINCWELSKGIDKENEESIHLEKKWGIKVHSATVLCLCKLGDHTFASSGGDGYINIINGGQVQKSWKAHDEWVWSIQKINDTILISGGEDGQLKLWNYQEGILITSSGQNNDNNAPINSLELVEQGQIVYVGRFNGMIECYKIEDDNKLIQLYKWKAHQEQIVRCLKVYQKEYLISGAEDNMVKIWKIDEKVQSQELFSPSLLKSYSHNNFVQDVIVIEDYFLSVSYDGKINKWQFDFNQ